MKRLVDSYLVLTLLLANVFFLLPCAEARAEANSEMRVVLVTNHADASIMPLLRAELQSLGFAVAVVDKGENEVISHDLREAARKHEAIAAFRVVVAQGTVELWVADRVTGKVVLRQVMMQTTPSKAEETQVVVQAVELLRASLLEIEAEHPSRGEVEAPPQLKQLAGISAERGTHRIALGPNLLFQSPEFGPFLLARLAYRMRVWKGWGWGIDVGIPLVSSRISAAEGDARVQPFLAGLGGSYEWELGIFEPRVALQGGIEWLALSAEANESRPSYTSDVVSPYFQIDGGTSLLFSRFVSVFVLASGGVATNSPRITFDGREVANFSRFVFGGTAGVEFRVP